jgi:hypothetical protein
MAVTAALTSLGPPIVDPEEGEIVLLVVVPVSKVTDSFLALETFLLFSRDIPSQNLGFVDSSASASTLDITVAGKDLTIHQSPTLLTSNRAGGTTGAGWCLR